MIGHTERHSGGFGFGALAVTLAASLFISGAAELFAGQTSRHLPGFQSFPATEVWKGPPAPVRLKSSEERMFRTNLRKASKLPPNFAGHYRFTTWGCGTRCLAGAVIDLRTGTVFPPPLAGKAAGEEHWIFCAERDNEHTVDYRRDSRLMIVRCGGMQTNAQGSKTPDAYYFVWEHDHFRQILHTSHATSKSR